MRRRTPSSAVDRLEGHIEANLVERELRRRVFAPPSTLTLSEWADEHRRLSAHSPEPGRWRTSRAPYLREIMDACTDPAIERVVVMKSARLGYTEGIVCNLIGYHVDQDPAPIMVMQPTVEDAKDFSKENVTPLFRDTPRLRGRVRDSGRRESKNTIRMKTFDGGFLSIVGSNSASGLRRRGIRIMIFDEEDGYGATAKGRHREGDPKSLALKRTENYWNRKIIGGSTPTIKDASSIAAAYDLTDQRRYRVPCPHCGYMQVLKWPNFRYENNDPTTVTYTCGDIDPETKELKAGCGKAISEDKKPWMVERGEWVAERPGRPRRGYHIWQAYSLLTSWVRMVEQWLEAQGDREKLQVFVNTVLAETWREEGEVIEHGTLLARRETYPAEVPAWCALLTAGVDVQGDRIEVTVWGWGPGSPPESGVIKHDILWGDPGKADTWAMLDLVLFREWQHALGPKVHIMASCVDSGGHHTDQVYRYCRARRKRRVYAVKGISEPGRHPIGDLSKLAKTKGPVMLGTEAIKDTLNTRLRVTAVGPGYVHFPMYEEEFFRQLTSEVGRFRYVNKRPVRRYEKVYERTEVLDCAVYAYAALLLLGPVAEQLGTVLEQIRATAAGAPPAAPRQRRVRSPGVRGWGG